MDKDLQSIQEARELLGRAKEAQIAFKNFTQEKVDKIVKAMADAGFAAAEVPIADEARPPLHRVRRASGPGFALFETPG